MEAHKAEIKRSEQRQEAEMARRLQAIAAQHEDQLAAMRASAAAERVAAAEAEKAAAREQVKDAQNRQMWWLRLSHLAVVAPAGQAQPGVSCVCKLAPESMPGCHGSQPVRAAKKSQWPVLAGLH